MKPNIHYPATPFDLEPEAFVGEASRLVELLVEVLENSGDALVARFIPVPGRPAPEMAEALDIALRDAAFRENLVQAYAIYFQLLNIAEEYCLAQRRREHDDGEPGRELPLWHFPSLVDRLFSRGVDANAMQQFLSRFEIQPVITAHPTEAKRVTILEIHRGLYRDIVRLGQAGVGEGVTIAERIKAQIEILWQTGDIFLEKPRVVDEIENGLFYIRNSFYPLAPVVLTDLYRALKARYPIDQLRLPPILEFSSWRGGDRDGNPFVTAEVTRHALVRHCRLILELYIAELDQLIKSLSHSLRETRISEDMADLLRRNAEVVPDFAALSARNPLEPYRVTFAAIRRRLQDRDAAIRDGLPRKDWPAHVYRSSEALLEEVAIVRRSLEAHGGSWAAQAYVRPFELRIKTFGFHLMKLDLRENSDVLEQVVEELALAAGESSYRARDEAGRIGWLTQKVASERPLYRPDHAYSPIAVQTLDALRVAVWARAELDGETVGSYIVSMTRHASDLLMVYLLCRETGIFAGDACPLSIVPLFETIDDLQRAPEILEALVNVDIVRRSIDVREGIQQVMIGYSDSNKDGGFVAAQWALHTAQSRLVETARQRGVELKFFHGMGGTLSRGGGPTHRTILALPPGTLGGHIKITEQGEVLSSKYLNPDTATFNLKSLLGSVMAAGLENEFNTWQVPEVFLEEMDRLSRGGFQKYRALVEDVDFVAYFRYGSPLDAIGKLNIGSRPAKRKETTGIGDLRAIPWVFSWTQNRHVLSGWYGAGTALSEAVGDAQRLALCRRMYKEWRFFRNMLMALKTSLLMADMELAERYAELCPSPEAGRRIFDQVRAEYARATAAILLISETATLEAEHPLFSFVNAFRYPAIRTVNLLQVELLRKMHEGSASDRDMVHLSLTINCVATGLRNTG